MPKGAVRIRLSEILQERNMMQKELAELCGLSENTISKLSGNPRQVRIDTIEKICAVLDIEPGELFDYEDIGEPV